MDESEGKTDDTGGDTTTDKVDENEDVQNKSDRRSSNVSRKRSVSVGKNYDSEDQALDKITRKAEEELAAKRAVRAEARSIRMKELEKHTEEEGEDVDKNDVMPVNRKARNSWISAVAAVNTTTSKSFRSSLNSFDSDEPTSDKAKDKMIALEENYRAAMLSNSQLINEKTKLLFEVDTLKDKIDDIEIEWHEAKHDLKKKTIELERQRKLNEKLDNRIELLSKELNKYVTINEAGDIVEKDISEKEKEVIQEKEEITFSEEEKQELLQEISRLKNELHGSKMKASSMENQSLDIKVELDNIKREFNKQLNDLKAKLQKAEHDNARLEANSTRFESQASRFGGQVEELEKTNDSLKQEKRKLQREIRQLTDDLEDAKADNSRLNRRLDKVKGKSHLVSTIN